MYDQHTVGSAVKKKMSLQYEVGQNYDARCIFHPHGTICNSKKHAKTFQDREKISRKANQKETIYRDSYELAKYRLDT